MVGSADERPDLLEIEQQGHVAARASEPPFALQLAVEDQPDDFLAHACDVFIEKPFHTFLHVAIDPFSELGGTSE